MNVTLTGALRGNSPYADCQRSDARRASSNMDCHAAQERLAKTALGGAIWLMLFGVEAGCGEIFIDGPWVAAPPSGGSQ